MDTCKSTRQQLSAYLDGELPAVVAADVRAHLARCEACAAHYDDLLGVDHLLDEVGAGEVDDGFTQAVLERLKARRSEPTRVRLARGLSRPFPRWAVAAVLIVAVGLGSGLALVTDPGFDAAPMTDGSQVMSRQFGLDVFSDLPGDTIGGAYVKIAGQGDGDGS